MGNYKRVKKIPLLHLNTCVRVHARECVCVCELVISLHIGQGIPLRCVSAEGDSRLVSRQRRSPSVLESLLAFIFDVRSYYDDSCAILCAPVLYSKVPH